MKTVLTSALLALVGSTSFNAAAWDPIGDITHPDRIVRNVGREADNAGREIDRMRLEAQAQAAAPALDQWFRESRNNASNGSDPIPPQIRQSLRGFYPDGLMDNVRFKVGDPGVLNLANLSIQYGDAQAVTLINVIVFKNANDAYGNSKLWAHELKHVQQFNNWGVRDFAIRYLRSWNSVEDEAYAAGNNFEAWQNQVAQGPIPAPSPLPAPPPPPPASVCATPIGACGIGFGTPMGLQCYCQSYNGPVWGVTR
jgi:hypothetical protein